MFGSWSLCSTGCKANLTLAEYNPADEGQQENNTPETLQIFIQSTNHMATLELASTNQTRQEVISLTHQMPN